MAFYPAPTPQYTPGTDLGDVIFRNFTTEGREQERLRNEAKKKELEWQIGQEALMQGAKGTDKYLGASNPNDFKYVHPSYDSRTSRQNADTQAGQLQHEKDWAPDKSQRDWWRTGIDATNASTAGFNAQTSRQSADTADRQADFDINTKFPEVQRHSKVAESIDQQQADAQGQSVKNSASSIEASTLSHLAQFLPPEEAAAVAKLIAGRAVPGFQDTIDAQKANDPMAKWLRDRAEKNKGKGPGAANEKNAKDLMNQSKQGQGQQPASKMLGKPVANDMKMAGNRQRLASVDKEASSSLGAPNPARIAALRGERGDLVAEINDMLELPTEPANPNIPRNSTAGMNSVQPELFFDYQSYQPRIRPAPVDIPPFRPYGQR